MDTLRNDIENDVDDAVRPLRQGAKKSVKAVKNSRTAKRAKSTVNRTKSAMNRAPDTLKGRIVQTLRNEAEEVEDAAQHLLGAIQDRSRDARSAVNTMVNQHPYAAAGIAFAVGTLLAGALFSRSRG